MSNLKINLPLRETCVYTQYYCEENIWHLCKQIKNLNPKNECYCVFISNPNRTVILWQQNLHSGENQFVIWDYHVIAVYGNREQGYWVLDLDTSLPFPTSFTDYAKKAIRCEDNVMTSYKRCFRVIPADDFLKYFSSDRRHMKVGDNWQHPPPNYPPLITNKECPHNLNDFINMDKNKGYGVVLSYQEFIMRFKI